MRPKIFIHTNEKQLIGALVSKFTLESRSLSSERFDVELIELKDHPELRDRQGRKYLRKGREIEWDSNDLQSFTPLRFLPPKLMGFKGRALVIDPDIFAQGDVWELLARDMGGKAIHTRYLPGKGSNPGYYASSAMLLDCGKLLHWDFDACLDEMFSGKRDYRDWVSLYLEDPDTIGELGEEWNSFDKLTSNTKLLHNTRRETQPWKTGLKVDFSRGERGEAKKVPKKWGVIPYPLVGGAKTFLKTGKLDFRVGNPVYYQPHQDTGQVQFFMENVRGALDSGYVTRDQIEQAIRHGNVRADFWKVLGR